MNGFVEPGEQLIGALAARPPRRHVRQQHHELVTTEASQCLAIVHDCCNRSDTAISNPSPTGWPSESLITWKRSRSKSNTRHAS